MAAAVHLVAALRFPDTPRPRNRRGGTTPVPSGPARSTRSTGQTPVPGMEVDPMSRRRSRSNSLVPNAGNLGNLTNQPTNLSTSYGGSHAVSAGLPGSTRNPTAGTSNFADSFQLGEAATAARGRGKGTPAASGRGHGSSHHLSPINEASNQSNASNSSARGLGRSRNINSRGAPSVSAHDVPIPSIEGRDAATFQDETAGPITNQSTAPRDTSPAESVDSRVARSAWGRMTRFGPQFFNFSVIFTALVLYSLIGFIIVDMIFFARMMPHTYYRQRVSQARVLFNSTEITQELFDNQQMINKTFTANRRWNWHVDKGLGDLEADIKSLTQGFEMLKMELPETLVLPGLDGSGQPMVPESFWHAARAFLSVAGGDEPEAYEFWEHFKATNAARLEAFLLTDDDSLLKKAVQNDILVDKSTVIDLIKNRINQLEMTMPHITSSNLSYALDQIIVANMRETLTTVNFFSRGMGALVIPELTSPTLKSFNYLHYGLSKLLYAWIPSLQDMEFAGPPTANQALRGWQEENDCWCSAKSDKGQAQLAVRMLHRVYPTKLVVEHIPKSATLDITTAPQRIELWLSVENDTERNKLRNAVNAMVKARATSVDTDKPRHQIHHPGSTHVFVGAFDYDTSAPNHVQVLEPLVSLVNLKIPIEDVVVRVASNHGQAFTCLYRVRMLGELVDRVNIHRDKKFP
ncbi:hypothetical protein IWZ03DRAFT_387474 [Phyllosticta citriasiana]|uniref:SUN domain-containing protein n=1 Tax=Phyllosticta citriasiana TaxID=595635 RepID=A0ABR1KA04_9PEZI